MSELGLRRSTKRSYRVRDRWITPKLVGSKFIDDDSTLLLIFDTGIGRLEEVRARYVRPEGHWDIEPATGDPVLEVRLRQLTLDEIEHARLYALVSGLVSPTET